MVDSFQKRDRDRRKRQERTEKQARRKERAALKKQRGLAPESLQDGSDQAPTLVPADPVPEPRSPSPLL